MERYASVFQESSVLFCNCFAIFDLVAAVMFSTIESVSIPLTKPLIPFEEYEPLAPVICEVKLEMLGIKNPPLFRIAVDIYKI